jgi:hypothetical protein
VHEPFRQAWQQAQAVQLRHSHAAGFFLLRPNVRLLVALEKLPLVIAIVVEVAVHSQDQKSANAYTANVKSVDAVNFMWIGCDVCVNITTQLLCNEAPF